MAAVVLAVLIPILAYHQVENVPTMGWSVSTEDFTDQMRFLQAAGYHVIPIAQLSDYLSGQAASLPSNPIVITADDGFADQYTNLNRVIKRFGFPWSLYIYPKFIDAHGATALTWAQVQQLVASGVDVESHTMSHPHLIRRLHSTMSDAEYAQWLHNELAESKRVIEAQTHKPVRFLCYPYGDWDAGVAAEAARDGYVVGLTSWAGLNTRDTNPLELHRSLVQSDTTFAKFIEAAGAVPLEVLHASPAGESVGTPSTVSAVIGNARDIDPATVRMTLLGESSASKFDPATGVVTATVAKFARPRVLVVVSAQRASDHRIAAAAWTFYTSDAAKQNAATTLERQRALPLHHK